MNLSYTSESANYQPKCLKDNQTLVKKLIEMDQKAEAQFNTSLRERQQQLDELQNKYFNSTLYNEREKNVRLQKQNQILINKLIDISSRPQVFYETTGGSDYSQNSLKHHKHFLIMQREAIDRAIQNERIAQRLESQNATISLQQFEENYKEHLVKQIMISRTQNSRFQAKEKLSRSFSPESNKLNASVTQDRSSQRSPYANVRLRPLNRPNEFLETKDVAQVTNQVQLIQVAKIYNVNQLQSSQSPNSRRHEQSNASTNTPFNEIKSKTQFSTTTKNLECVKEANNQSRASSLRQEEFMVLNQKNSIQFTESPFQQNQNHEHQNDPSNDGKDQQPKNHQRRDSEQSVDLNEEQKQQLQSEKSVEIPQGNDTQQKNLETDVITLTVINNQANEEEQKQLSEPPLILNDGNNTPQDQQSTILLTEQQQTLVPNEKQKTLVTSEQQQTLSAIEQQQTLVQSEQQQTIVQSEQQQTLVQSEQQQTIVPSEQQKQTLIPSEQTQFASEKQKTLIQNNQPTHSNSNSNQEKPQIMTKTHTIKEKSESQKSNNSQDQLSQNQTKSSKTLRENKQPKTLTKNEAEEENSKQYKIPIIVPLNHTNQEVQPQEENHQSNEKIQAVQQKPSLNLDHIEQVSSHRGSIQQKVEPANEQKSASQQSGGHKDSGEHLHIHQFVKDPDPNNNNNNNNNSKVDLSEQPVTDTQTLENLEKLSGVTKINVEEKNENDKE